MYTVEYAEEWGVGGGVNGYGKRSRVFGYYVLNPLGRRCRAFSAGETFSPKPSAKIIARLPAEKQKAEAWAAHLNATMI